MSNVILFNKPFQVLSQFIDSDGRDTLAKFLNSDKCKGYYAAGRLDYDSEGLMVLTNNGALQNRISSPAFKLAKTYWAQVEGLITEEALQALRHGVVLKDGKTLPAKAQEIPPPEIWTRTPPIRIRRNIPTSWLELTISEGKNRQVRRMTAAVNLPTLRLIRYKIGPWQLDTMQPGEHQFSTIQLPASPQTTKKRSNKRPIRSRKND